MSTRQPLLSVLVCTALGLGLSSGVQAQPVQTFTTCGASGAIGPEQGDCDSEYGTDVVTVVNGVQNWTVPQTGIYRLTATGGDGASATEGAFAGGRGVTVAGDFFLTAGAVLQIVVGQHGQIGQGDRDRAGGNFVSQPVGDVDIEENNGGGGGGSFIVDSVDNPLLIAGGGGGTRKESQEDGCDGVGTEFATRSSECAPDFDTGGICDLRRISAPTERCQIKTTDLGMGGTGAQGEYGSGGAGFFGDGVPDNIGDGGSSWANGMYGGQAGDPPRLQVLNEFADGGFGGGGSGEGGFGGGGGGGYSGVMVAMLLAGEVPSMPATIPRSFHREHGAAARTRRTVKSRSICFRRSVRPSSLCISISVTTTRTRWKSRLSAIPVCL